MDKPLRISTRATATRRNQQFWIGSGPWRHFDEYEGRTGRCIWLFRSRQGMNSKRKQQWSFFSISCISKVIFNQNQHIRLHISTPNGSVNRRYPSSNAISCVSLVGILDDACACASAVVRRPHSGADGRRKARFRKSGFLHCCLIISR
uniref:(northern house mosquito) hypothetical protein n=1 Tax=Culex pipiens TaxID=7175 RepID=A0A8D8BHK5_CULPI